MRIAIVDDIAAERQMLHHRLSAQWERRCLHADIAEYESGEAFLTAAKEQPFAAVFLDIYMTGANGIETAKNLRGFDQECLLIFTTTSTDHALDGFRVRAMHYLVKPYTEEELDILTDEILQRIPSPDKFLEVKANGSNVRLRFQDILYAEHFPHQMQIKIANGATVSTRQTFGAFTAPLKEDLRFFVCSRGVIINLQHAMDFDGSAFLMTDGTKIGVSRDLQKTARQIFMDFLFKGGRS